MAQAQKHWIQAMLHEETWIPFDVTYDVTAWSNPLLMNLDGGWSGDVGLPASTVVPRSRRRRRDCRRPTSRRLLETDRHARLRVGRTGRASSSTRSGASPRPRAAYEFDPATLGQYDVVVIPDGFAN